MGGEGTLRSPLPGIICPLFVSIIKRRRWRSITRVVTEQRATLCLSIPLNFLPFALPFLRHLPHGDMVNTSPLRLLDTASARSTSVPIQPLFSSLHFFLYRGRYGIDAANANRGGKATRCKADRAAIRIRHPLPGALAGLSPTSVPGSRIRYCTGLIKCAQITFTRFFV